MHRRRLIRTGPHSLGATNPAADPTPIACPRVQDHRGPNRIPTRLQPHWDFGGGLATPCRVKRRHGRSIDCRHTGGLEHLCPFLLHRRDERREFGRAGQLRAAAELDDTGLHLRIGEALVDHAVEPGDDIRRRAGGIPLIPCSAVVGTSDNSGMRSGLTTPIGLSLPVWMNGMIPVVPWKVSWICPESASLAAAAAVL